MMMMIVFVSIFLCLVEHVTNNPILPMGSPRVILTLSTLQNISKMIDEANRCPSQTENALCSWNWVPDIKETRLPRVIYKAEKRTDSLCERDQYTECRSTMKQFNVMYRTQNPQGFYDLLPRVEVLPVTMDCVQKQTGYTENGEDVDYNMFD